MALHVPRPRAAAVAHTDPGASGVEGLMQCVPQTPLLVQEGADGGGGRVREEVR